jgi:hypothetical protein
MPNHVRFPSLRVVVTVLHVPRVGLQTNGAMLFGEPRCVPTPPAVLFWLSGVFINECKSLAKYSVPIFASQCCTLFWSVQWPTRKNANSMQDPPYDPRKTNVPRVLEPPQPTPVVS